MRDRQGNIIGKEDTVCTLSYILLMIFHSKLLHVKFD